MPQVSATLRYGIAGGFKMNAANQTPSFIYTVDKSPGQTHSLKKLKQTFNNLISQAGQMVTYAISNDMMKIAGAISGIIIAPIIQKGRRVSFRLITWITFGFVLLTLSMVYTTVIQKLIYQTGPCYDTPLACAAANDRTVPNQISAFLQIPTYFVGALAGVFCLATGTEYAYNHTPKGMKTLVQATLLAMAGVGTCLALAFTPLTNDPHLAT
ncbi:Proton-dependent oligopeptide transporter family, partial [Penicillium expansum]